MFKSQLSNILCDSIHSQKCIENYESFTYKFSTNSYRILPNTLPNFLNLLNRSIFISMIDSSIVTQCDLLDNQSVSEFNDYINGYIEDGCTELTFEITINKVNSYGYIEIFSVNDFIDYLYGLDASCFISNIYKHMNSCKKIWFKTLFDDLEFETKSVIFSSNMPLNINTSSSNRSAIVKKSEFDLNHRGTDIYDLLPDDFHFVNQSENHRLNQIFWRMTLFYDFCYIFNFTDLHEDLFKGQIRGDKVVNIEFSIKNIEYNNINTLINYHKIYDWIYNDTYENGHYYDKRAIAQNILSLYLTNDNIFNVNIDLFTSTVSAFKIYLKKDVEKYIEAKGSVLGILNDINSKLSETSDSFSGNIKNNLLAFVTFLFSTFLMNTISNGKIENIFTKDIATISYGFIIISLFYLIITEIGYIRRVLRFADYYHVQKSYYNDILDPIDIDNIFLHDEIYKKSISSLIWNGSLYSLLWIVFIILSIISIRYLSGYSIIYIIKNIMCMIVS